MSYDYSSVAATASRLVANFGKEVIFKREPGKEIDPVTGVTTSGTPQTYRPKGIFQRIRQDLIDGTRIKAGDKVIVVADFTPELSDKVEISGNQWSIMEIIRAEPGDTVIVSFVRIRK
jgi:hypothetical protein